MTSSIITNSTSGVKNLTLNYINRLPSPSDLQQVIIPPASYQQIRHPIQPNLKGYQNNNFSNYMPTHIPPPQIQPSGQHAPYYYTQTPFYMSEQYLQPSMQQPIQIIQQQMPPPPSHPLPQQNQNSNQTKRISLNSSTGNIFDTLSAANSLINNF